jgi:tetratricopeptide (TPR) repeat protein
MPRIISTVAFSLALAAIPGLAFAQNSPPKDKDQDSGSYSSSVKPNEDTTTKAAQSSGDANYDPFHAQQDVEIGAYYMHKGDVDAAISRYQDAIQLKADFAKPRILLAEAYLKKGEKGEAVKYYKEYLKVFPDAPDAKKVRNKIEKLSQ